MKKTVLIILALLLLLSLAACGEKTEDAARQGSGLVSQSSTVNQILESAAAGEEAPAETAPAEAAPTEEAAPAETVAPAAYEGEIDVDLTQLSATVVYSEVSNMMTEPERYVGKVVRMAGQAASTYYDVTDMTYHAIIIADATACCAQGIEYVLSGGQSYPDDNAEAVVTGVFGTYDEFGRTYIYLEDAVLGA